MKTLIGLFLAALSLFTVRPGKPAWRSLTAGLVDTTTSAHHLTQAPKLAPVAIPVKTDTSQPNLAATSVYAIDIDSGATLYDHNSSAERPIASITKLVTAMVILRSHKLDETITVGQLTTLAPEDAQLGITAGQQFKLGALLKAALIPSDNDAAEALAIYDSGSVAAFSAKMNSLAAEWGISGTHFASANGLVDANNFATAHALAQLARIALANPDFATIVNTASATIVDSSGKTYQLSTTDQLLGNGQIHGIKTGYTVAAGESFVALADIRGHRVITVVLNSPDRFGETSSLVNWIEGNYKWQ